MKLEDIIKMEKDRQEKSKWNVIHLVKEGDFYRAHDWSAWLMSTFPFGEAVEKPLKVIAKKMKDGYIDAFLGFPASSISKYVPESVGFQPVTDQQIDVTIEMPFDTEVTTVESLNEAKEAWKNTLPLQEPKKQAREDVSATKALPRVTRFTDIITQIISVPMESISPREAYDILRNLRNQTLNLF